MQPCSREEVQTKWKGLCLPVEQLESLLSLGSFSTEIDWMEFFALGCGALGTVRCSIWSDINPNNTSSSKGQTQLENRILHLFCSPKVQTRARQLLFRLCWVLQPPARIIVYVAFLLLCGFFVGHFMSGFLYSKLNCRSPSKHFFKAWRVQCLKKALLCSGLLNTNHMRAALIHLGRFFCLCIQYVQNAQFSVVLL